MNLIIRPYEIKDAVFLAPLIVNELGYDDSTVEQMIMRLRRFHVHPDYHIFVALDYREVIGFVGLHKCMTYAFDQEYIKIEALKIKASDHNHQVETELLKSVETYAKKRGIHKIIINSVTIDPNTTLFYEQMQYHKIGDTLEKKI